MCIYSTAQKQVFTYPFEFEKSFLKQSDYDAFFLNNDEASQNAFILKDNKKAAYILSDKNFKVQDEIKSPIDATVFDISSEYVGGTASGKTFHFVHKITDSKYFSKTKTFFQVEHVDFNSKTLRNEKLFEVAKSEKLLASFSDYNRFIIITADDKQSLLQLYILMEMARVL